MNNSKPKRIILFITDHQRYDTFSALGHPVIKTPNFDKLMTEGVTFTRAYSHCPLCIPARANLWTGLPAHVTGVMDNTDKIPLGTLCLPEFFTDLNWYTVNVGRLHFSPFRNPHGFQRNHLSDSNNPFISDYAAANFEDRDSITAQTFQGNGTKGAYADEYLMPYLDMPQDKEGPTSWVTRTAINELAKSCSLPTFMNIGYIQPHPRFCAPEGWDKMYDPHTIPLPEERHGQEEELPKAIRKLQSRKHQTLTIKDYLKDDILRQNMSLFYGDISHIDQKLGELVSSLKENGMWEDTLLICTSDHGEMIGNHALYLKSNFYEESAHVPMILSWPNGLPAGTRVDEVVSLQDIFTTCIELMEHPWAERYKNYRHANLVEMVYGSIPQNNRVFIETKGGCEWGICNVSKQYKYSFYTYDDGTWDDSLYNIENDPRELTNIVKNNAILISQLRSEIVSYLEPDIKQGHFLFDKLDQLKNLVQ